MSSVEGNENIEEVFNQILKEEYKQEWQLIVIPQKLLALFCYAFPALLMLSSGDYHSQNVLVILFFSAVLGTGFYSYVRHHAVLRAFFSNDKPLNQVVREVQAQSKTNTPSTSDKLTQAEESDWSLIVSKFEKSMEQEDEDSDTMNLSNIFDRAEPTTLPPKRASWLSRFFGRK